MQNYSHKDMRYYQVTFKTEKVFSMAVLVLTWFTETNENTHNE